MFIEAFLTQISELYNCGKVSIMVGNCLFLTTQLLSGSDGSANDDFIYQTIRAVAIHINNTEVTGLENLNSHSTCIKTSWA